MQYRTPGNTNILLSAIGLGCMGMNHAYGTSNDEESIATLEKALLAKYPDAGHRCNANNLRFVDKS